ncbi:MAG: cell division protein FtsW, partial [Spirochaetaceae bacterium]|nr:cell division protein FtsW [Spirochaetaceae bacterium]
MNVEKIFAERTILRGRYIDTGLLVSIILLWGLGLLILYICSANYAQRAFGDPHYFINRQLIMSVVGLV